MKKLFLSFLIGITLITAPIATKAADDQGLIASLQAQIVYLTNLINQLLIQRSVSADAFLVIDIATNEVIWQKNSGKKESIASITKLMNAVVAKENIMSGQTITVTPHMLTPYGYSPAIYTGLSVSRDNLMKAMLIQSTNDAAEALSYFVGKQEFIRLMNKKAADLGMQNTTFVDTHGYDLQNQSTTADLAKLMAYIKQHHPDVLEITKDTNFQMMCQAGHLCQFKNLNTFHQHPDFSGGKTGYLKEAKESVASLFSINGKTYAIVVLKSDNHQADTLKIVDWIKSKR